MYFQNIIFHIFLYFTGYLTISQMPNKEKVKRWHKDCSEAQFIVRQIINKKIDLDDPNFRNFIRDFPSFKAHKEKNFHRNFLNCVDRWKKFVNQGQGKNSMEFQ